MDESFMEMGRGFTSPWWRGRGAAGPSRRRCSTWNANVLVFGLNAVGKTQRGSAMRRRHCWTRGGCRIAQGGRSVARQRNEGHVLRLPEVGDTPGQGRVRDDVLADEDVAKDPEWAIRGRDVDADKAEEADHTLVVDDVVRRGNAVRLAADGDVEVRERLDRAARDGVPDS